ncbi:hypothetical protein [Acetobacter pasteurianus]|uniref:hypothetical protein n=1 Tax=Acetobacter pasteurianus TaxID=438 RepID=UPI000F5628E3|nr:hypothetical protein [Acetobacter pasteurianus]GCD56718.1 hypothetical protein NBRC3222_2055 [Acetobacter pasteurianus NBRC 3222]
MMNKLEINLAVAKNRHRDVLKALDEVRVKQIKAAKVVSMLQAEKDTLADVQEQVNNIRLDAMETGKTTVYLPSEVSKKYERLREIDEVLPAALRRQEALTGEIAVTQAAVDDAEEAIRREAGAILAAEQEEVWKRAEGLLAKYVEAMREVLVLGSTGHGRHPWSEIADRFNNLTPMAFREISGEGAALTDVGREKVRQRYADLVGPVGVARS